MKNRRKETKLAAELDRAALKRKANEEKVTKKEKRSRGGSQGVRPIGDDFSSQNEEAEDELERVGRGPT
jgi:hypothetical protein